MCSLRLTLSFALWPAAQSRERRGTWKNMGKCWKSIGDMGELDRGKRMGHPTEAIRGPHFRVRRAEERQVLKPFLSASAEKHAA